MQNNTFIGNLAAAPLLTGEGDRAVAKFVLISNEYAGTDADTGDRRQRTVSLQFAAFRKKAEALVRHADKGDQLIVRFRIENNNYERDGAEVYGFNFIVEDFTFGAPGPATRDRLAAA